MFYFKHQINVFFSWSSYFFLTWFTCFLETTDCCSLNMNMTVNNAFISCPTNWSCTAECYRGFVFPSGSTKEYYSCQNGVWTPMLPSCKRTLVFFFFHKIESAKEFQMDLIYIISFGNFLRSYKSVCFLQNENESVNDNLYVWLFFTIRKSFGFCSLFSHLEFNWGFTIKLSKYIYTINQA